MGPPGAGEAAEIRRIASTCEVFRLQVPEDLACRRAGEKLTVEKHGPTPGALNSADPRTQRGMSVRLRAHAMRRRGVDASAHVQAQMFADCLRTALPSMAIRHGCSRDFDDSALTRGYLHEQLLTRFRV